MDPRDQLGNGTPGKITGENICYINGQNTLAFDIAQLNKSLEKLVPREFVGVEHLRSHGRQANHESQDKQTNGE